MILLSDANVLIDLGHVGGLALLPQLGRTEVLATVLVECDHTSQPDLVKQIRGAGIVVVDPSRALLESADSYADTYEELSFQDRQCLAYARDERRTLLTGDSLLRTAAQHEQVSCHGTIWLVEEAHRQNLVLPDELCRWLTEWPLQQRRLPKAELRRLNILLGCRS